MIRKSLIAGLLVLFLTACSSVPFTITSTPTISKDLVQPVIETSTPLLTPSFTPSPTPNPEGDLQAGDKALFEGDYDRAQTEYQDAFSGSADPAIQASALWGLGQIDNAIGNSGKALKELRELVKNYPGDSHVANGYFLLGDIYASLERYSEAVDAYNSYLSLRPGIIDYYVQFRIGDSYDALGDYSDAIKAYKAALNASHISDDIALQIKIAQAYASSGDTATALSMYSSISQATTNDYVKAQIDLLTGRLYLSLGQTDLAYQSFLDTVNNYPLAYDSYSALVALVNDNVPVDDLNRGLVDYFAGQNGNAVEAFQRYIAANPDNDGTAIYYEGLALFGMGNYDQAIQSWNQFIQSYPDNSHWAAAWDGNALVPGLAYTQWYYLGQYDEAAQTLLTFVKQAPSDPNAPIYLQDAGRIQERAGKLEEAAQTWERIADEYPSSELVPQSVFLAGISRYRAANYAKALLTFQRDLQFSITIDDQARAYFWIGKSQQASGDNPSAVTSWQQAASLDPTGYYSLRSEDMLLKRSPFSAPPAVNYSIDLASERAQAEGWIRVTFNLPTDTDLTSIGNLANDPRLIRGTELWNLGLQDDARLEFENLRTSIENDPSDSFRLSNYLLDLGLYRPAIFAMRQVLTLAGMNTQVQTLAAPPYFNHVRYGLYYQDLVLSAAQQAGLDPLFLFSVIRQESLFEGFVRSSAGARGLMQITPDTGDYISNLLGWPPNYSPADLYRPIVSITLGASYLQQQNLRFDNDLYTALAAYNAGPEAAPIWRDLSGPDSDLFLEIIRFGETGNYIRSIYENYYMYRNLYGSIHQ